MNQIKSFHYLLAIISTVLLISNSLEGAKEKQANKDQPLSNLDNLLRQQNAPMRIENLVDSKMANNITNVLNEMAFSMNKMILENKRLSSQLQDVLNRVQNSTGVNAPAAIARFQQQAPNITSNLNDFSLTNLNKMVGNLRGNSSQ